MTPELKAKWLADLRSGNYHKTKLHLKDNQGYCCLGVLCESAGFEFKAANGGYVPKPTVDGVNVNMGNELSTEGMKLFGLPQHDHDQLAHINDTSKTFAQVIDYIERNITEEVCNAKTNEYDD